MKKTLLALCLLGVSSMASAEYLCSYQARISDDDKYNSSGMYLAKQANKTSVAAILRQERANYHKFNLRNREDTNDCVFGLKENRAKLEQFINNGRISRRSIESIIYGNPLIRVDIYTNYIDISVQ